MIKLHRIRNHYINGCLEVMANAGKTSEMDRGGLDVLRDEIIA